MKKKKSVKEKNVLYHETEVGRRKKKKNVVENFLKPLIICNMVKIILPNLLSTINHPN